MADGRLQTAIGRGRAAANVHSNTVSAADGDTYDTGMDSVDAACADVRGNSAGSAGGVNLATVSSVSGGTLTFDVATIDGTDGGAAQGTAQTVDVIAVGEV